MNHAVIFHGTIVVVFGVSIFLVRARQARREMDETMANVESAVPLVSIPDTAKETERLESSANAGLEQERDVNGRLQQTVDMHGHDP